MDSKRYTEVLIDGRIYTLGGYEDEGYMQRVASYINEMITTLKLSLIHIFPVPEI